MPGVRPSLAAILLLAAACSGSPPASQPASAGAETQPTTPIPTTPVSTPPATRPPTRPPTPSATATATATATVEPFAWSPVAVEGAPAAREDHTWTVDAAGEAAWLFGGRDGSTDFDDLWRYDLAGDRWQRVDVEGEAPSARFGHGAAWLPGTGLVVWAGQAGTSFFADLWAFDPDANAWRELPSRGDVPPARYGSCLALGPDGRLWISHGFTADAGRFGDTRAWDPVTGRWTDETSDGPAPVVRCLHDCLWTPDGRLALYAGQTTGVPAIGDLWTFASGTWSQAPEADPPARQLYALAASGSRAWVFGGGDVARDPLGDLWRLDLDGLGWAELDPEGEAPAARIGATLIADDVRGRLLLWGGHDGDTAFGDLWTLPLR